MNKRFILLLILISGINSLHAQTRREEFNALLQKKDTLGQRQLLEQWEKNDKKDPELYIAWFNYYVQKSRTSMVRIDKEPRGNNAIEVMNEDSTVAYMFDEVYYTPEIIQKGFDYIDKGIGKYPTRLDMRFGKIYMLNQTRDYENFTSEIIKAIEYSAMIKNKWDWSPDRKMEDGKSVFLGSLQNYQLVLYNTENDALLENMKRITTTVLKYYPDHIESLLNLGIMYTFQADYDKALEYLLQAEKVNHKDYAVLSNIANAYKGKGDKKNALAYYEKLMLYGDEGIKSYAEIQINELNNTK